MMPAVIVRLLFTVKLLEWIVIPGDEAEVLLKLRLLNTRGEVPAIDCVLLPRIMTPAVAAVELSVNVPLLVRSP